MNPETDGDEPSAQDLEEELDAKKLQAWTKTHLAAFPIAQVRGPPAGPRIRGHAEQPRKRRCVAP